MAATTPVTEKPRLRREFARSTAAKLEVQVAFSFCCGHTNAHISPNNEGILSLECPACPIPGKNMPEDWQERFKDEMYVFHSHLILLTILKLS